jgi:hypothetical protein
MFDTLVSGSNQSRLKHEVLRNCFSSVPELFARAVFKIKEQVLVARYETIYYSIY